jgi:hypothetical protein
MSAPQAPQDEVSTDPVEKIVPLMPIVLPVAGDFYIFTGVDRLQRGGRAAGTAPLDARSPDLLTGSGAVRNCLLIAVAPFP